MDPAAPKERVLLLDVLRGFAIFGMFTVNMTADLSWGGAFVGAVITYGWGFGLYGQMTPLPGLFIVLAVFPLQVLASHWWIRRFNFGPFEWCWRAMTYGQLPAMRSNRGTCHAG